MALRWELTGRANELLRVHNALARRRAGVLFAGAAGVGKTRVAREAEAAARAAKRPTAWVAATRAAASVPLGAFSGVLADEVGRVASATRLIGQAVAALERLSERRRALVCVDDAHLLDDVSAAVVHQLALNARVTLAVTVRAAPAPDAITALWKDDLLERVELTELPDEAMSELLRAALGGPVETSALARLTAMAMGNVLLLRHLVDGELAAGRLVDQDGCWRWHPASAAPERIRDLLGTQLGAVVGPPREVLELLAVAEPLPLAAVDRAAGRVAVQECEAHTLVELDEQAGQPCVRLAHPLYAEVLRDQIRPLKARALRTELVQALDGAAETDRYWLLRRCVLALDSDAEVPVADLNAASAAAMALLDEPLAERLCRAAVDREPSFESQLRLGYSLIRQERRDEGAAILRELAERASETQLAMAVHPIAASLFWDDDDPAQALAVLDEARGTMRSPVATATIDALRCSFAAFLAQGDDAARLSAAVLAQEGVGPASRAWACAGACMAAAVGGHVRRVDELFPRGRAAALASDTERFLVLPLANGAVLAYGLAGELDSAGAAIEEFLESSNDVPSAQARAAALLFRGQLALWRGELPDAARLLEDAAFGFNRPYGAPACWEVQCLTAAVSAHAAQGDVAAARDAADRLGRHTVSAMTLFEPDIELASACVAAAEGAVGEAVERGLRAAQIAREHGLGALEVEALHRTVRWGDPRGAARLRDLAETLDGPRVALAARHANALADRDPAALAGVGDGWAEMGARLLAAEAWAQAAGLSESGKAEIGGVLGARARQVAAEHQARTPALAVLHDGVQLTRREREVAMLAAAGLSNADIASRLTLSTRTVEGHLQQAYGKLGVHNRSELAEVLAP